MERADSDGILRGIRNPGNVKMWSNPTGPGEYVADVDGTECPARVKWPSVPAYSQRKGQPQETVRMEQRMKKFDEVNQKRSREFERIVRKDQALYGRGGPV